MTADTDTIPYRPGRPRVSVVAMIALILLLTSLPAGLGINLLLLRSQVLPADQCNAAGFLTVVASAALSLALGWWSLTRIRSASPDRKLVGSAIATAATYGSAIILLGCLMVELNRLTQGR